MNVLLLHLDGKMPNVALMRLAAYHRTLGDRIELRRADNRGSLQSRLGDPSWDRVYGSLIFQRTRELAARAQRQYPGIVLGGTGWSLTSKLEDLGVGDVLDYSVYPKEQRSIGFSQRGCRMSCEFCVVPKKEGKNQATATIAQLWRGEPYPKQLVLLDNDFFGQHGWRDKLLELRDGAFEVSFCQGINARMLTPEAARALAELNCRSLNFKERRIYTAWDNLDDERTLMRGLNNLVEAGFSPRSIMVYVLVGYWDGETHEKRDYRRAKLREFGALPYPMPYVRDGELGEELRAFARWVVGGFDPKPGYAGIPWVKFWHGAKGSPRRLGQRRVSLPLWKDDDDDET